MAGRLLAEVTGASLGVELEEQRRRGRERSQGPSGLRRPRAGPDGRDPPCRGKDVPSVHPPRPRSQRVSRRPARHGPEASGKLAVLARRSGWRDPPRRPDNLGRMSARSTDCPKFQAALEILGRPWTGLILNALGSGPMRYGDLAARVNGVGDKTLSARPQELKST